MKNFWICIISCAVFLLGFQSVTHANLISNGSFEIGPPIPSGASYRTVSGGSTEINGWLVTGGTIDIVEPGWNVSDGIRAIDLDGASSTGGIQQTISTIIGEIFTVSFDLSGNPARADGWSTSQKC